MPGAIIYRGPSLLDPATNIVVVAISRSTNRKTGDMLQTYILVDDPALTPQEAVHSGADYAICGDCPHRGVRGRGRSCYVTLMHGPLATHRALHRGRYLDATSSQARRALGRGRMVRIGTYGDGAAVPADVWFDLLQDAQGHTGYTHQLHHPNTSFRSRLYMVSADSYPQAERAWASGYRTFRIVASVDQIDATREVLCPASAQAGHRTTCEHCGLCAGNSIQAKSVAIPAHGIGSRHIGM
jgi:hypothetical protein